MKKQLFFTLFLMSCQLLAAQNQTIGNILYADTAVAQGYTLFAPMTSKNTYLIDNCGRIVNEWSSDFFPGASVYLQNDGSLVRACRRPNNPFNTGGIGGRIERRDWNDSLTWFYVLNTDTTSQHHDIALLPNGNILAIVLEKKSVADAIAAGRNPAIISDTMVLSESILELQPVGTNSAVVVWEWHAWDHLIQDFDNSKANYGVPADHPELLDINYVTAASGVDWLHFNSVAYNADLDQILISSRHLSEILIIDHSTSTAEAASHSGGNSGRGGDLLYRWGSPMVYGVNEAAQLDGQHGAAWVPAGYPNAGLITVFNNNESTQLSEALLLQTPWDAQTQQYTHTAGTSFAPAAPTWSFDDPSLYSARVSNAQALPNGNMLICEGMFGTFWEVTPDKSVVWKYISPVINTGILSQGTTPPLTNSVFRVQRYTPDFAGFVGKDLTPGAPIELNPDLSLCPAPTGITNTEKQSLFELAPNPASTYLQVQLDQAQRLSVYTATGQLYQEIYTENNAILDISQWQSGLYIIKNEKGMAKKLVVNR